jgi:hypothetical protein
MKRIIIIFTFLVGSQVTAQTNTTFNKFIGTWQWVSGNDTVRITLEQQTIQLYPGFTKQSLVGWHKYVKNGIQIQSSMQYIGRDENLDNLSNDIDAKNTLRGHAKNSNSIWFTTFWDLTLHKRFYLFLTLIPNSTTQAGWKLRAADHTAKSTTKCGNCVLPKDLILTKQ